MLLPIIAIPLMGCNALKPPAIPDRHIWDMFFPMDQNPADYATA